MKPGVYKIEFESGWVFTVRIEEKRPNEARVIRVDEANETVIARFLKQVMFVDSLWTGKIPIFKSKSAKPLQISYPIVGKERADASLAT